MKKYIFKSIVVLFSTMLAASCTGSFDDVNTDPDNPIAEETPSTNILAYAERYATDNMFDEWFDLNETCGFSGQIAKLMYTQEGYYNFRPTVNSSSWRVCDYVTAALKTIINQEDPTSNMWAVATIFQCQIWQIKTDRWGNIPYYTTNEDSNLKNEALQLEDGFTTPAYDKQQYIYPDLLDRLAKAVAILEGGKATDELGDGDVLLGGDTKKWIKYANGLRLRIAARIARINPSLAQSTLEAVVNDGLFPESNDDNVFFQWNQEYAEPWADYYQTRHNEYGVSALIIKTMQDDEDPRLEVYADSTRAYKAYMDSIDEGLNPKGPVPAKYKGYPVGTKKQPNVREYSQIGSRFQAKSSVKGFSPWLRCCETYFALAYLKNLFKDDVTVSCSLGSDASADDLYKAGVDFSLEENDVKDYSYYFALPTLSTDEEEAESAILKEWWKSVYKNGQEAWSVYRMAQEPSVEDATPSKSWLYENNKIAVDSYYPDHNCPPMCYGYPDTERNLNSANCGAESAAEVNYFWGKKMWWDTRTGLY